jgi:hypothetical protein
VSGEPAFRCTVPHRARSAILAVAGFILAAAFLPGLLIPSAGWMVYVLYACSLIAGAFGVLCMLAALAPRWFLIGVAVQEHGFEYRRPLRRPKTIPYSSINRIDAVRAGDGETGEEVRLVIYSDAGKATVTPDMLYPLRLVKVLESRLALDLDALRNALRYEPRGMDLLVGTRFLIYEKRAPLRASA